MEKIIITDQYANQFNKNYKDQYFVKQDNFCKFVIDADDQAQLRETNILLFKPIYKEVHHKKETFSYNEALSGHTFHDFSEIADFIKVNEIDEVSTVLENDSFKKYLLSMPQNHNFYIDIGKEPFCEAIFPENKAYVYDDGSIGRKVEILYFYPPFNKCKIKQNRKMKSKKEKVRTHNFILEKNFSNNDFYPIRRLSKTSNNPFYFFDQCESIKNIQLIKGPNNHVSKGHSVENRKVLLTLCLKETNKYSQVEMVVHYCEKCKVYFDFYDSFIAQLKRVKIDYRDLLVNYFDKYNKPIKFEDFNMRDYSKLRMFGYSVGNNGLRDNQRHRLLKKIIEDGFMSPVEIKNHLEFLIRYQGKRKSMEKANESWLNDIQYINNLIKTGIR